MRLAKNQTIKIGKKLQAARCASAYTQEEVSELVGCSSRYIGQLEGDHTSGSLSIIIKLCNIYKISLHDIYGEYIDVHTDLSQNLSFSGYLNLSDEYKSIIDNNIAFLNSIQKNKTKK